MMMWLRSRRHRQSQRGAALVLMAMAAVVILFAVVVAHSQLQSRTTESSLQLRNDVQSRDVARSGLELAMQQLREAGGGTTKFTACRLNTFASGGVVGLPQFQKSTYTAAPGNPDEIEGCTNQTGTQGPRALVIGNSCVTWWFGLVDEVNQVVQIHVSSVSPYVSRGNDDLDVNVDSDGDGDPDNDTDTCNLEGLADGGGVINSQGGVTYSLSAIVSTWTAGGRPASAAAGTYSNPCTGSVSSPCVLSVSYDKRTFNL